MKSDKKTTPRKQSCRRASTTVSHILVQPSPSAYLAVVHQALGANPVVVPVPGVAGDTLALVVFQFVPVHALGAAGAIRLLALLAVVNQALSANPVAVPVPGFAVDRLALVSLQLDSREALEATDAVALAAFLWGSYTHAVSEYGAESIAAHNGSCPDM